MSYLTCMCVCVRACMCVSVHRNCLWARSHPAHTWNCTFPLDSGHCGWHGCHRCGRCISQVSFQTSFSLSVVAVVCCSVPQLNTVGLTWYMQLYTDKCFSHVGRIARVTIFQLWLPPAMRQPHAIFGGFTSVSGCWLLGKEIVWAEDSAHITYVMQHVTFGSGHGAGSACACRLRDWYRKCVE